MKELEPDWFKTLSKKHVDLDKIRAITRKTLTPPPVSSMEVPPFRGLSRTDLLTRAEAAKKLEMGMTTLDKLIRDKLIFPQYRGRLVKIPIEEIENYNVRASIEREKRHA